MAEHVTLEQTRQLADRVGLRVRRYGTGYCEVIGGNPRGFKFGGTLDECAAYLLGYAQAKGIAISVATNPAREMPRITGISHSKGKWTKKYKDELPDSHFFIVDTAKRHSHKDGFSYPLSVRHLPFIDKQGKINLDHLRNAISRAPQTTSV